MLYRILYFLEVKEVDEVFIDLVQSVKYGLYGMDFLKFVFEFVKDVWYFLIDMLYFYGFCYDYCILK